MNNLLFTKVKISNFLCFGGVEEHEIRLKKNNIIIGPNNSGKSAILKVFRFLTSALYQNLPDAAYKGLSIAASDGYQAIQLKEQHLHHNSTEGYFIFNLNTDESLELKLEFFKRDNSITVLRKNLCLPHCPDDIQRKKLEEIEPILRKRSAKIIYIPSNRRIGKYLDLDEARSYLKKSQEFGEEIYDGNQLLPNILNWCNPSPSRNEVYRQNIEKLQEYCKEVLDFDSFTIRPVPEEWTIYINFDGKDVSIENVGYGIQQSVIIIAAIIIYKDRLLLLEEPEIGLHPTTQRRLLDLLFRESQQLICTTHSNHIFDSSIIDREDIAYFKTVIDKNNGISKIDCLDGSKLASLKLLAELGVKPNSIYESNCLIWVEGPSDKLYIEWWLKRYWRYCEQDEVNFPKEGLKYTYLYYGGALIANYTFLDEGDQQDADNDINDISVFVDAIRLHPNFYIYADSDKRSSTSSYGHQRLVDLRQQLQKSGLQDRIWISHGKEVESYLPEKFYRALAGKGSKSIDQSLQLQKEDYYLKIHEIINKFRIDPKKHLDQPPNKVDMAKEYIEEFKNAPFLDLFNPYFQGELLKEIENLYQFIIQSNKL